MFSDIADKMKENQKLLKEADKGMYLEHSPPTKVTTHHFIQRATFIIIEFLEETKKSLRKLLVELEADNWMYEETSVNGRAI